MPAETRLDTAGDLFDGLHSTTDWFVEHHDAEQVRGSLSWALTERSYLMEEIYNQPTSSGWKPRLSLIVCSRNDQWQGNSLWRLQTTLNYAALQAAKLDRLDDVEIIVTDWGSTERLSEAVRLTADAARIVRYLNVPTKLAREKQKDSPFAEVIALNAAARRSRGDYIGRIDQDTLVGRRFFEWFFSAIETSSAPAPIDSTVMISNRRRIPYAFAIRCLPFPVVEKYVGLFHRLLPRMRPPPVERYWECYIGILLLNRKLWDVAGGYDESFIYYGHMEFDFFLRLRKRFAGVDLGALVGCDFYHLDHIRTWSVWTVFHETVARSLNSARTLADPPLEFCPNGKDWGLANYDIPLVGPGPGTLLPEGEIGWRFSWMLQLAWVTLISTIRTGYGVAIEKAYFAAGLVKR